MIMQYGLGRPLPASLGVNFPLCLAPMVGLSHVVLRSITRKYLPTSAKALWPSEMLNSRRLPHENFSTVAETLRSEDESIWCPQILGNEERFISPSVTKLMEWGAQAVDINMGCPVKKALQHNYGVSLMGDASYAAEVVNMAARASNIPISVKLRAGQNDDLPFLLQFTQGLQDSGASWITLHPRLASEQRRSHARWERIGEVRNGLSIPVIGNGDIQTLEDVLAMFQQTDCDLVMAGRALAARPWMMWQLAEHMGLAGPIDPEFSDRRAPFGPDEEGAEYGKVALEFVELCRHYFAESLGVRKFKFWIRTTSPWMEYGQHLLASTAKVQTYDDATRVLRTFFETPQRMNGRTLLRQ
jgi:tRNA-dihydrouridine synthase B